MGGFDIFRCWLDRAGEAATAAGAAIVEVTALNLEIDNCQRVWRLYFA